MSEESVRHDPFGLTTSADVYAPTRALEGVVEQATVCLESDRVHGLDVGADDYITKPFSMREFIVAMRAIWDSTWPSWVRGMTPSWTR